MQSPDPPNRAQFNDPILRDDLISALRSSLASDSRPPRRSASLGRKLSALTIDLGDTNSMNSSHWPTRIEDAISKLQDTVRLQQAALASLEQRLLATAQPTPKVVTVAGGRVVGRPRSTARRSQTAPRDLAERDATIARLTKSLERCERELSTQRQSTEQLRVALAVANAGREMALKESEEERRKHADLVQSLMGTLRQQNGVASYPVVVPNSPFMYPVNLPRSRSSSPELPVGAIAPLEMIIPPKSPSPIPSVMRPNLSQPNVKPTEDINEMKERYEARIKDLHDRLTDCYARLVASRGDPLFKDRLIPFLPRDSPPSIPPLVLDEDDDAGRWSSHSSPVP